MHGHIHSVAVVGTLPEMGEQPIPLVDYEPVNAQDKRRTEDEGRDKVYVTDQIHGRNRVIGLRCKHLQRFRDENACTEEHQNHNDHDPMENAQERTEQIKFFAVDFFHSTVPADQ
jgi:serine phosphatase RsbU (regulator of sigma subunit)